MAPFIPGLYRRVPLLRALTAASPCWSPKCARDPSWHHIYAWCQSHSNLSDGLCTPFLYPLREAAHPPNVLISTWTGGMEMLWVREPRWDKLIAVNIGDLLGYASADLLTLLIEIWRKEEGGIRTYSRRSLLSPGVGMKTLMVADTRCWMFASQAWC